MSLTGKQSGVLKGVIVGALMAITIVSYGSVFNPFGFDESISDFGRLKLAIVSALFPALFLVVSVGRLAKHRFFTPKDIDGGGLSQGSDRVKLLQSILQNTLEQFNISCIVYLAWVVVMPARFLSVVPLGAIAFSAGRILFFIGYKKGAPSRAVGFALTFYPPVIMLISILGYMMWQQLS